MSYPQSEDLARLADRVHLYCQLQHEYGAAGVEELLAKAKAFLEETADALEALPPDPALAAQEPDDLDAIRALRPEAPRKLWAAFDEERYADRLAGAFLGRCAGCTLGAPVEFWDVPRMERLARENGDAWPPEDYWTSVPDPADKRYRLSRRDTYTRDGLDGVPVDDDIAYTLLGLLVLEDHGPGFTVADNGAAWTRYLPYACTAEEAALRNLKAGIPAERAAAVDNPYREWIGADIRADPWGYAAPGWPEQAAELAWRDAFLSHRRQGIYGEMYFAAAIAAAFAVEDPVEALRLGLNEIPKDCALAKAVRWAFEAAPDIKDHAQARAAMDEKFGGMHRVHTINNACLTVWGITIGGTDFTRVIGETVAMGMDNDCTAATAGSIVGACVGRDGIPAKWTARFNDTVHSYLIDRPRFSIGDLLERFAVQARQVWDA